MKAAVLFANEDIRYADFDTPVIAGDEVLVKMRATGICGSDVPRVLHNGAHFYPIVLGHEFSGEIVEVGKNAGGLQPGERVTAAPLIPCMKCADCQRGDYSLCRYYSFVGSREPGSFAEYVKVPARNVIRFADSVSFEQGAFFEPCTVALHGIKANDYRGGGDVAVLGGGTVGLFTMQWAKIYGAKSVTVYDISDERLELCRSFGADRTVNTSRDAVEKDKYRYVFETAGITDTMRLAFEIAANKANVCFIGTPTKDLTFTPALFENMNRKEFRLTGSWMSYSAPFPGDEWTLTAHFFQTGALKFADSLIFKKFPLSGAAEAFSLYKTPGAVKGKIMLING